MNIGNNRNNTRTNLRIFTDIIFPLKDVQTTDKQDARNKKVMILKSIYPLENRRHCPRHHHFIDMPFLRLKIGSAAFLSILPERQLNEEGCTSHEKWKKPFLAISLNRQDRRVGCCVVFYASLWLRFFFQHHSFHFHLHTPKNTTVIYH